jgi:hypothetical protein
MVATRKLSSRSLRKRESAELTVVKRIDENMWTFQAEMFLSDFIWNDGDVPRNGRLVLKRIDRDALQKLSPTKVNK